ncbi:hypothetical protein TOPH_03872 [Tolypocladium ophioglossoides CBS 100239]|uniref:GH64 domain-containing protein n=1 Tax=Tolypocladium ophioglossoides (strain CBS 100239) TaxID=1163406 RepID=A0A0L0ND58_TOLOC|nr:hypothetical protein TOPH_03872 [Tolypocladium ophioglossoides CBS 100239]
MGAISVTTSLIPRVKESFSIVRPGGVKAIVMTDQNTLNGTYHDPKTKVIHKNDRAANANPGSLPIEFVNRFDGGKINAYVTGLDSDNKVVFVTANGTLVYPSSGDSDIPVQIVEDIAIPLPAQGNTFKMTLPITIFSGRVYFAEGDLRFFMVRVPNGDGLVQPSITNPQDPSSAINWGFVELTYTEELAIWANISYVDFVGLILSMGLTVKNGGT